MRAKYYSGEEPHREPEGITEVLGSIIERVGAGAKPAAAMLVDEWGVIAPDRWKTDARPVGIRRGVLVVEVRSGAVATLLRHDTAVLLERVADHLGDGVVNAVKLRVSTRTFRSKNP